MGGHQKKKKDVEHGQPSGRNQVLFSTLFSWPLKKTGQKAAKLYKDAKAFFFPSFCASKQTA